MRAMKGAEENKMRARRSSALRLGVDCPDCDRMRWSALIRIAAFACLVLACVPPSVSAQIRTSFEEADQLTQGGDELSVPRPTRLEVLLLETRRDPRIDPVVGNFIDARVRFALSEAGWEALSKSDARALLRADRVSDGASMGPLRRLIVREEIALVIVPIVYASQGKYVVELWIARGDVDGVVAAQVASEAATLGPAIDALLEAKLPSVLEFDRQAARNAAEQAEEDERLLADAYRSARTRSASPKRTHWAAISLSAGSAIGPAITRDRFSIHMLRTRLELRPRDRLGLGLIMGYANLPGQGGRAHNLPILGEINYRVPIAGVERFSVPIRFAMGYLPFNGPIMRTSVGLHVDLPKDWEIGFDVLSPTVFRSPSRLHFAFDLAFEVTRRFGRVAP